MSTHGKSAITSSDRTRTEVKKEIPLNTAKSNLNKNQESQDSTSTESKSLKPNVKRRINQKRKPITNTSRDIVLARREAQSKHCLLYTSPSPRDKRQSRMPSSA